MTIIETKIRAQLSPEFGRRMAENFETITLEKGSLGRARAREKEIIDEFNARIAAEVERQSHA